jgi:hypothetical protein
VRIGFDPNGSAAEPRRRSTSSATSNGFADVLTAATREGSGTGPEPELSSATYRLFAAIAAERGDAAHATHFRNRAAEAREAGLPLHPSGVLAENGRWDYTPAAAAIPETGRFDSRSGQGVLRFTSYGPADVEAPAEASDAIVDRLRDRASRSSAVLQPSRGTAPTQSVSLAEWWDTLRRVG